MIPDFGTWHAEQRFKPGTRVRVCNGLHYHGKEGVVTRFDLKKKRLWIIGLVSNDPTWELYGHATSFEVIDAP